MKSLTKEEKGQEKEERKMRIIYWVQLYSSWSCGVISSDLLNRDILSYFLFCVLDIVFHMSASTSWTTNTSIIRLDIVVVFFYCLDSCSVEHNNLVQSIIISILASYCTTLVSISSYQKS